MEKILQEKNEKNLRNWIFVLVGVWLLWFVIFLPIWEGFDEPAHFCYVQHLIENREIPQPPGKMGTDYCSEEIEQTLEILPLPRMLDGSPQLREYDRIQYHAYWKNKKNEESEEIINDITARKETRERLNIWEGQHPPLPYVLLGIPYLLTYHQDFYVRFMAMRLFSVLMVMGGLWMMWKTVEKTVEDSSSCLLGFSLIALHPMFFVHFGRISNEPLTFFLISLTWYLLAKIFSENRVQRRTWIILGIVYAMGLLSKVYFFSALPALFIAFCVDAYMRKTKEERRERYKGYSIVIGSILCVGIPLYLYQPLLFVIPGIGLEGQTQMSLGMIVERIRMVPWIAYVREIFLNFIGLFGWSFIRINKWFYIGYLAFWITTLIGFIRLRREKLRTGLIAALFPLSLLGGMAYYNLRFDYLAISGGWYLYTFGAMLATIIGLAWQKLISERLRNIAVYIVIVLQASAMAYITIHYLIPQYYAL